MKGATREGQNGEGSGDRATQTSFCETAMLLLT